MNNNAINALLSCKTPKDIQACINAGSDINTLDSFGRNILFYCKNPRMIDTLVKAGIDFNHADNYGHNVLFNQRNPHILKKLIDSGVDIHHKNGLGQTCLCSLADNISCCKTLINSGINVNNVDKCGRTILFYVKNHSIFDLMVQAGCDINHRDNQGHGIFEICYSLGDFKAKMLIRHISMKDSSPVIFNYLNSESLQIMDLLQKKNLNFTISDNCQVYLSANENEMSSFFSELKKKTDISNTHFRHIVLRGYDLRGDIETIKWFIRNDIKIDKKQLEQHIRHDEICKYIAEHERKKLSEIMKQTISLMPVKRRL